MELLTWANSIGLKWFDGDSYIDDNRWYNYHEDTCYDEFKGTYWTLNFYKKEGYTILSFEEVLLGEAPKTDEIKECDGKWNGYYIEASQEAYDLLIADGITVEEEWNEDDTIWFLLIHNNHAQYMENGSPTYNKLVIKKKPLYIVDGKLSATQYHPNEVSFKTDEIEELKKKYATGKYDCYIFGCDSLDDWTKEERPLFTKPYNKYKLILKEHSLIADAVIDNPNVEIEFNGYLHGHRKWCEENDFFNMYEEEAEYRFKENKYKFEEKVTKVLEDLKKLLIDKNKKYGNSALEPIRVFSKATPQEQLLVRIDDKLSRLRTQSILEDEDVLEDLLGYLVLLKISINDN